MSAFLVDIGAPDGLTARPLLRQPEGNAAHQPGGNLSLPSDPRLSASESANPHVRPNIASGAGGPRFVPGTLVCGPPENPRSCEPGDDLGAESTRHMTRRAAALQGTGIARSWGSLSSTEARSRTSWRAPSAHDVEQPEPF